jgi:hypothetical protein
MAVGVIRAALDLAGITLPKLEVEGGPDSNSVEDGKFILHGVQKDPEMYAPPTEGEWLWKIKDADGPDGDYDDNLHLYIVINRDDENLIECYAQILQGDDEVSMITNMDDITDKEYQELVGNVAGETPYIAQQRHVGNSDRDDS